MNTWQGLERDVVELAEVIWSSPAAPETVNGVKCDCVVKVRQDYWALVEVSKSDTLEKLRTDLAKFATIKPYLMSQGIYAECHFVHGGSHQSLDQSARGQNVNVHSPEQFFSKYLGSIQYLHERKRRAFGSAVDPDSGDNDTSGYVPIAYVANDGSKLTADEIAVGLKSGKKYILLGEFGSGKSRCLMEVFNFLSKSESRTPPLAINLRDNWGYKKFSHILQNHLDGLGLGNFTDAMVRSATRGMHPILLDGFDELGSQSWSGDVFRLSEIRKGSMQGVRDLVQECKNSGILITGREHYFNSESEMMECLGLNRVGTTIIYCPNEFTEDELRTYISERTNLSEYPSWLPKKPLLCQLLTRIDQDSLESLVTNRLGEITFFESVLDAICVREAKIHPTIFKDALKNILLELATLARTKNSSLGPIGTAEISTVFEKVTGSAPIDESAIVLQRLPYLGRTGSGSADRLFIDDYAIDGLQAIALVGYFFDKDESIKYQSWRHPLGSFGYRVVGSKIKLNDESIKYFKNIEAHGNAVACADFVASVLLEGEEIDFRGINVLKGAFSSLDLSGKSISNLSIAHSEAKELILDNYQTHNVSLESCIFEKVIGISSKDGFPRFISNCEAGEFEDVLTVARISDLNISDAHKTLLSIIKKLFFQPGKGRKEEALLRGTEKYWDEKIARKLLKLMMSEGLVDTFKGDDGLVYVPTRSKTVRARRIMSKLGNCGDTLWDQV